MITTKRAVALTALIIGGMLVAGALAWNALPETMVTHWNAAGEANGTSSRTFGVLFAPLLAAALAIVMFFLPKTDPLATGFKAFRKEYDGLILVLIGFLAAVQAAVLLWNLGAHFDFMQVIGPGVGLLFFYLGAVMPQMKRNWFAGIRTPWTLSSDKVWKETHELGGKLFRLSGLLAVLGAVFTDYAFELIIIPIVASSLVVIFYSYHVYRKEV